MDGQRAVQETGPARSPTSAWHEIKKMRICCERAYTLKWGTKRVKNAKKLQSLKGAKCVESRDNLSGTLSYLELIDFRETRLRREMLGLANDRPFY